MDKLQASLDRLDQQLAHLQGHCPPPKRSTAASPPAPTPEQRPSPSIAEIPRKPAVPRFSQKKRAPCRSARCDPELGHNAAVNSNASVHDFEPVQFGGMGIAQDVTFHAHGGRAHGGQQHSGSMLPPGWWFDPMMQQAMNPCAQAYMPQMWPLQSEWQNNLVTAREPEQQASMTEPQADVWDARAPQSGAPSQQMRRRHVLPLAPRKRTHA